MNPLLLSVHDDDSALFAAFTCLRERPRVLVCLDSYIQPARGEVGCSAEERAAETAAACRILGCEVIRLGIRDDEVSDVKIIEKLLHTSFDDVDTVYAPAIQGGNAHHDMVGRAALKVFNGQTKQYTTYSKTELYTTGTVEIVPTAEELRLKKQALDCYESQIRINLPHFQAVLGKSEWLMAPVKKLHLGCGKDAREGYVNLDRHEYQGVDTVCDATKGLPFPDNSFDEALTQDFMEHLPQESKVFVINELWRILRNGGTMEHWIPNAGSRNDFGSPTHLSHWNLQQFEHFDVDSYRWAKDHEYEGFIGGFKKITAELVNFQVEEDGIKRAQSIHVKYAAVKE